MRLGCAFNLGTKEKVKTCNIITDEGETLCPRHILLSEQRRKDDIAKDDRKIKSALERGRKKVKGR